MTRRSLTYITLGLVAALVVAGIVYSRYFSSGSLQTASIAPLSAPLAVGDSAPAFTVATTAGLFDLAKEKRPIFLEIFATWCPHCQRETAVIDRLYAEYGNRVSFIAVVGSDKGMDYASPESSLDLLAFQQRFGVTYPIATYDPALTVAQKYLHGGFPTIVLIGRDKKILSIASGEIPYDALNKALRTVLIPH